MLNTFSLGRCTFQSGIVFNSGSRRHSVNSAGSSGAPAGIQGESLVEWEQQERLRVAAEGGVLATVALAQAERLRGLAVLDSLAQMGRPVEYLRQLLGEPE